jgi:type II secretory pathway pseudopilin PulG
MEWWASLGWSLLIGWLFTQWMQSQNNVGARAQQQAQVLLQRAQEAAGAAQNAAASTSAGGKKGKNKKQNAGAAAKGLGGGLDGGGDPSSSSPAQPGAPGAEVRGAIECSYLLFRLRIACVHSVCAGGG